MGSTQQSSLHVAIVGAGITGLTLAIGLQARNVRFTIYERAASFRDAGAGIGLSANAERAMSALSPDVRRAFENIATPNGEDYFQWIDGFRTDELIYRLPVGENGFRGCRRSDLLEELFKVVPTEAVVWGRELDTISEVDADGLITLKFKDGSISHADIVIGCDGIRSRVRQLMLGVDNPTSYAAYTHKYCFRALIPMDKALAALGAHRAGTRFMYNGPDGHLITYPVADGSVLNVVIFITDERPWRSGVGDAVNGKHHDERNPRHTGTGRREDALTFLTGWHETSRAIAGLLPTDDINKWAIFDMLENPARSYARGSVCVAGDAAHASGPHLGAGAGFGIEDALALATVIERVASSDAGVVERSKMVSKAVQVYNDVRYERTQWLIGASREAVALFEWQTPDRGADQLRFSKRIAELFHTIWDYDLEAMVKEALYKLSAVEG